LRGMKMFLQITHISQIVKFGINPMGLPVCLFNFRN